MVATDFEFNGIKLTDVNWRIVNFNNSDDNEVAGGGEVTFNTSKAINSNRWNSHGKHYESPLSAKIQVAKYNCQSKQIDEISSYEQTYYKRILEDVDTYKPFRILCDGYEDIYYMATMKIQWYQVGGSIIGADSYSLSLRKTSNASAKLLVFEQTRGKVCEYTLKLN